MDRKRKTIGPRPELIDEIKAVTNIELFYMYSSSRFLEYANKFFNFEINQYTIDQVEQISKMDNTKKESTKYQGSMNKIISSFQNWLIEKKFDNYLIELNYGFPDFVLSNEFENVGVIIKFLNNPSKLFNYITSIFNRCILEIRDNNFSDFEIYCIFSDNISKSEIHIPQKFFIPQSIKIFIMKTIFQDDDILGYKIIKMY